MPCLWNLSAKRCCTLCVLCFCQCSSPPNFSMYFDACIYRDERCVLVSNSLPKNYRQINWIIYRVNTPKTVIWLSSSSEATKQLASHLRSCVDLPNPKSETSHSKHWKLHQIEHFVLSARNRITLCLPSALVYLFAEFALRWKKTFCQMKIPCELITKLKCFVNRT